MAKARENAGIAKAKHERKASAACIMEYEARIKAKVPAGELIVAPGSDSDVGSRVSFLGVTSLVSKDSPLFSFKTDSVSQAS